MRFKKYQFCAEEMLLLMEAMAEYSHQIKPEENASERRIMLYKMAMELHKQFKNDLISSKEGF